MRKKLPGGHVDGKRLPELSLLLLDELYAWAEGLEQRAGELEKAVAGSYLTDLQTKIRRTVRMGLDYLTLDRQAITLSGGESQRLKLAAALDSSLSGIIYVIDEPTAGLHEGYARPCSRAETASRRRQHLNHR